MLDKNCITCYDVFTLNERHTKMTAKVETYELKTATGKHIRKATKVTLDNGTVIKFTERMSKRDALKQAEYQIKK